MLRTNRSVSTVHRLLRLAGAAAVGIAASAMFIGPASAWTADLKGAYECDKATGEVTVHWAVKNEWPAALTVTVTSEGTLHGAEASVPAKSGEAVWTENVFHEKLSEGKKEASLTVTYKWQGSRETHSDTAWVKHIKCEKPEGSPSPSAPASPSPSPSTGGAGGGAGTPTVPAPGLPVTGPNASVYGGIAGGLLAVGVVLFVVARRRRVRFEA